MASVQITANLSIAADEIAISYIRASGPGGQNVNKVSSAAQLRFDLGASPSLTAPVKARAARLAGTRLTLDGVIVITADRFRTQALNREDAVARLVDLLKAASVPPKPRRKTKPTFASKLRRLDGKTRRSGVKKLRSAPAD